MNLGRSIPVAKRASVVWDLSAEYYARSLKEARVNDDFRNLLSAFLIADVRFLIVRAYVR